MWHTQTPKQYGDFCSLVLPFQKCHIPQIREPILIKIGAEHEYAGYGCCLAVHGYKGKGKGHPRTGHEGPKEE